MQIALADERLLTLPPTAELARCQSMTQALIHGQTISGLQDKELCGTGLPLNDTASWSRIKGGSQFFPQDNLIQYMRLTGNAWPAAYLAYSIGYMLRPLETELMRQLREANELIHKQQRDIEQKDLVLAELRGLIIAAKSDCKR
jgi:hypothetical protein